MTIGYLVSENDGEKCVTAFINGEQKIASASNPNFDRIVEKLFENDEDGLVDLFEPDIAIGRKFKKITERVSVSKGKVFFDMSPIENTLSEQLMRLIRDGNKDEDIRFLVNFWEKIATNPQPHARDNLMRWLNTHDFSITPDGDVVGYKGLRTDHTSVHAGPGIVNGVATHGHLDNSVGNVIEIDRAKVVADARVGCAFGLHVGTYEYAKKFSHRDTVVEVVFNPRDAVSVPTDCNDAKIRVCRYVVKRVMGTSEGQRTTPVVNYDEDNDFTTEPLTDWNSK